MVSRHVLRSGVLLAVMFLATRQAAGQAQQGQAARQLSTKVDDVTRRELVAARDAIWRAWFGHDTTQLNRLLPRAAASAEPEGYQSREEILEGSRQFAASGGRLVSLNFSNTQMFVDGNVAVVHSTYRLETETNGKRSTSGGRATEIFVRQDGWWVNPFWHLQP